MFEAIGVFFIVFVACLIVAATYHECQNYDKVHEFGRFKKRTRKMKKQVA